MEYLCGFEAAGIALRIWALGNFLWQHLEDSKRGVGLKALTGQEPVDINGVSGGGIVL